MFSSRVRVHAPATVANLVCGFDILGMSLNEPYDIMEVSLTTIPGVVIKHHDNFNLPEKSEENVAGIVLLELIKIYGLNHGFEVNIDKRIKPGSGLGSSAASAAGAIVAANHLLGNRLSLNEMVQVAMYGEKLASGIKHADNVTPCITGGISLIRSIHPLDIVTIPAPSLHVTVIHPQIEVKTSDARQILKQQVSLKDAIRQWGNIAGLVTGLMNNDSELISRSLEDVIIEPVRSILIPGFKELKEQSISAGAIGGGIAGSGPSVFMFSASDSTAKKVEDVMKSVYDRIGLGYYTYVTTIGSGVKIVSS